MRSVMKHSFARVPSADIQRSSFNRSHGHKTTFDSDLLIPIFVDEVLPGDSFNLTMELFCRLATPLFPIMDNARLTSFFFFVPNRLVWDNWERFNGAQDNPDDSTDFLIPTIPVVGPGSPGQTWDYFGLPNVDIGGTHNVNALIPRSYNLIWNEWFRDQNLQDAVTVDKDDGPNSASQYFSVLRRGKRHDYFTSCLPWPQKGDSVSLPLGTSADVLPAGRNPTGAVGGTDAPTFNDGTGSGTWTESILLTDAASSGTAIFNNAPSSGSVTAIWDDPNLYADLSSATAATINQIRQAFQIQRLLERDARGGTRYTEIVRSHFGVTSPDARLQRPEYLGGATSSLIVSPVPQTSDDGANGQVGKLSGYGTIASGGRRHGFTKSFTEHGHVIGLIAVTADLTYQQGLNRMWSRQTRYDFYWPALSHLGEQAVLSKEIYADGTAGDEDVFGYQERYAEYRYKPSMITGLFRSSNATSLDAWHLSQDFDTRPVLDDAFIQSDTPFDRVIAVPSEPHFIGDFYFKYRCARPMPTYSIPGYMDHF